MHLTSIFLLIGINCFFLLSRYSLFGYYSDTLLVVFIVLLIITYWIKNKKVEPWKLVVFIPYLLVAVFILHTDLNFSNWGSVKRGTVTEICTQNKKDDTYKTLVYYQLNENDEVGPGECKYWEKKTFRRFPIIEWTIREDFNCCSEIEELK